MKLKTLFIIPILLFSSGCSDNEISNTSLVNSNQENSVIDSSSSKVELPKWSVKFYSNYDDNTLLYEVEVEHNSVISEMPKEEPKRSGYTFTNWYRDTYCKVEFDSNYRITSPLDLYAGWEEVVNQEEETYSITWNIYEGVVYEILETIPTTAKKGEIIYFGIRILDGYVGTPIVKANNQVLEENNGMYSFEVNSNVTISVSGIEKEIPNTYHIEFTLPSNWSPIATNPRLYYWGSETASNTLFNNKAKSNMSLKEENTYYIDLPISITFDGIIIIFDQGNDVKQSIDIVGSQLPTERGNYEIVVDWSQEWVKITDELYCFNAIIEKL